MTEPRDEPGMSEPGRYDDLIISRKVPVVEQAPQRTLISVSVLRAMHECYIPDRDLIYVGQMADGGHVYYRIVGWDADQHALVAEREER